MSENVDVVRALFEAVSRRDYDTAAHLLDPDAEWHNTAVFPGPRTVRGARAISQFWRDMFESYGGFGDAGGMEIEQLTEGDDVVVVQMHGWWRAAGGEVPLDARWAHIFWLRRSKICRGEAHGRYATALEAARLRE